MGGRIPSLIVVDRGELQRAGLESRLLGDFPHHAFAGRLIDVGPAAGQGPFAVADLAHHQNPPVFEGRAAHIHLGRGVAVFLAQQLENRFMLARPILAPSAAPPIRAAAGSAADRSHPR